MALITSGSVPFRFTPFHENGTFNPTAVLPMAELFKQKLRITAVWVMGMRGQFDTLTVAERKAVALAWTTAGKQTGLFILLQARPALHAPHTAGIRIIKPCLPPSG